MISIIYWAVYKDFASEKQSRGDRNLSMSSTSPFSWKSRGCSATIDRKLKTSFSDFWEECGGIPCEDKRFYVIPVEESRKEMSELKPSKRANHRRRYELMDGIAAAIATSLSPYLNASKDK